VRESARYYGWVRNSQIEMNRYHVLEAAEEKQGYAITFFEIVRSGNSVINSLAASK
jgi:hypothetical protein